MTTGLITRYNKPCPEYHIETEWRHENIRGYIRYDSLLEIRVYTRDYDPRNEVEYV